MHTTEHKLAGMMPDNYPGSFYLIFHTVSSIGLITAKKTVLQ